MEQINDQCSLGAHCLKMNERRIIGQVHCAQLAETSNAVLDPASIALHSNTTPCAWAACRFKTKTLGREPDSEGQCEDLALLFYMLIGNLRTSELRSVNI